MARASTTDGVTPDSGSAPRHAVAMPSSWRCRYEQATPRRNQRAAMDARGSRRPGGNGGGSGMRHEPIDTAHGRRLSTTTCLPKPSCFCGPSPSRFSAISSMMLLLLAALFLQTTAAVSVPFENCLPDNYVKNTDPVLLQWVPRHVEASFNSNNEVRTLLVTMYGNVTGSRTTDPLPGRDSPDWRDANKTAGKILREPQPDSPEPKLTTLHRKVDVLTYEPYSSDRDFCNESLINATCPLGPVFTDAEIPYYGLPSVAISNDFYSSYAFTSFSATFIIKYGDDAVTTIGCVSATVTPDLGNLAWMLKFLPLIVLLAVGVATIFAAIWSPWGSTDIFHWSSNYGRDADLLRLVTPGFGDCLQYIQFIALTGGLSLNYPGFYQPIVSQASWSTLMFNESFVSKAPGWQSLVDGIYVTSGGYGLQNLASLVGMGRPEDIWAGMMVWLLVIIAGAFILCQLGFGVQWIYRAVKKIPEEDHRAKNFPFSMGNVTRIIFNYFLLPIVALSTFQLVAAGSSPAYPVALAVLTLVLIICFAIWLLYLIISTKPRAVLFDDLPTVLLYGPLYNTYSDEAVAFALIPVLLTFIRGIAFGAVQPSGIAQIVVLAICEVIHILTLHAFRPFHTQSHMNAYHTLFAVLRLISILLMIAFIQAVGVTEGPRGWIGYAILVIHAGVLILGFFLNAIQTILEVTARMAGAGGDDVRGQTRGGLSKIFGMRQLSRRMPRRAAPSRQSQLSSTGMLDAEEASKSGYIMPGGRIRSESAGSMGGFVHKRGQRSSSALDNNSIDIGYPPERMLHSGASSFTPTTPGEVSNFSFLPSPGRKPPSAVAMEAADPYYRPPRAIRRPTMERDNMSSPTEPPRGSWGTADWSNRRFSQIGATIGDPADLGGQISRGPTPAPGPQPAISFAPSFAPPRTDYSTREVDFYYGVRGQRLNSDAPSRKLGTGPADPTGPMASAAGWLRGLLGGKTKEKGKGFEVVRSSRMPPAMKARGGDFSDDAPPEGIPVAMGVLRNGPIESDDEDEAKKAAGRAARANGRPGEADLVDVDANSQDDDGDDRNMSRLSEVPPVLPDIDAGESIRMPSRIQSRASRHEPRRDLDDDEGLPAVPHLPRKSSRRTPTNSRAPPTNRLAPIESGQHLELAGSSSRLPFERSHSQRRLSGSSMGAPTEDFSQVDLHDEPSTGVREERPTSFGYVHQGSIQGSTHDIHPDHRGQVDLLGSSAEVVDMRR